MAASGKKKGAGLDDLDLDHKQKRKPSLLHSANKLFTTGFIESVLNQKNCSTLVEDNEF